MYWHWVRRVYLRGRALSGLFAPHSTEPFLGNHMTETYSKSRQKAETAFGNLQSQFFARNHAGEEIDFVEQARQTKTARLREARLAKEAERDAAVSIQG
jgi:hypothetical protein